MKIGDDKQTRTFFQNASSFGSKKSIFKINLFQKLLLLRKENSVEKIKDLIEIFNGKVMAQRELYHFI